MNDKLYDFGVIKVVDFENAKGGIGWIIKDIISSDCYGIKNIQFQPNDKVIDIGANIGIFSIYLAKLHPEIKVYSFEPSQVNMDHFLQNIQLNHVTNIEPIQLALTNDRRRVKIYTSEGLPGGSNIYCTGGKHYSECKSITLDDFLTEIGNVKMIKCDIENAEHEVFMNLEQWDKIEYLSMEGHEPYQLLDKKYSKDALYKLLTSKFQKDKLQIFFAN